ncbi:hypothetical protein Cadr_000007758 [Camelus dromedarius]|uniref:Uncharacterized protein n=1 Tax=Camelus dromedarius TaxID=9838 RepID=A0A5N4DY43_CAMDR|nr:hypothetical protein Cadr_000007758 [Camelus dromedarius]
MELSLFIFLHVSIYIVRGLQGLLEGHGRTTANLILSAGDIVVPVWPPQKLLE